MPKDTLEISGARDEMKLGGKLVDLMKIEPTL